MWNGLRRCSLLIATASVSFGVGAVQPKRGAHVAARPAAPKASPAEVLVNSIFANSIRDGDSLSAACRRSNFKGLAYALEGMGDMSPTKGEFETQAQFQERSDKLTTSINNVGKVIVCQELDGSSGVTFTYDADLQTFSGSFSPRLHVASYSKDTGKYASKTRMGIPMTVHSSIDVEYIADFEGSLPTTHTSCATSDFSRFSFTVPVSSDQAPLLKLTGYLVVIGNLVPPFFEQSDNPGQATLDDPYEVYERDMSVQIRPTEVAIVGISGQKVWDCSV